MRIMIIGGMGYIGSRVGTDLHQEGHEIVSVDLEWFPMEHTLPYSNVRADFGSEQVRQMTHDFDAVLVFAGHASVKMCHREILSAIRNNVENLVRLAGALRKDQFLIYASTSSVYGVTGEKEIGEASLLQIPVNEYDLSKQVADLVLKFTCHRNYWGLRMGTVCGGSMNLRTDLMLNAMYHTAKTEGKIVLYGGNPHRPILWMGDLVRAVRRILSCARGPGMSYNLASYNSTAEECANDVAAWTDVEIERRVSPLGDTSKLLSPSYDFAISTDTFHHLLDFTFEGRPEDILGELDLFYPQAHLADRDRAMPYGS